MDEYTVRIYPAAKQDLIDIIDYLNTLSPEAALRYYDLLTEQITSLSHMPERCRSQRTLRWRQGAIAAWLSKSTWFSMLWTEIPFKFGVFCMAGVIILLCYSKPPQSSCNLKSKVRLDSSPWELVKSHFLFDGLY